MNRISYYVTLKPTLATFKDVLGYRPPHRRASLASSSEAKIRRDPKWGKAPITEGYYMRGLQDGSMSLK